MRVSGTRFALEGVSRMKSSISGKNRVPSHNRVRGGSHLCGVSTPFSLTWTKQTKTKANYRKFSRT